MNIERIRERLTNGFKPFVLELSSGKRVKVPHPDFIAIGKNVVAVMGEDDSLTSVDALHIVSITELPASHRRK